MSFGQRRNKVDAGNAEAVFRLKYSTFKPEPIKFHTLFHGEGRCPSLWRSKQIVERKSGMGRLLTDPIHPINIEGVPHHQKR